MADVPEIDAGLAERICCRRCGRVLAISVEEGRKMILRHGGLHVYDAQILCADCNVWRPWHSRPASAVRLGIEE
jgi:hypothetical protein